MKYVAQKHLLPGRTRGDCFSGRVSWVSRLLFCMREGGFRNRSHKICVLPGWT